MQIYRISRSVHIVDGPSQHGNPSPIAMDLKLPDNTGAEGVVTLKKYFPDAHLTVLSGSPAAEHAVPRREAGADVYILESAGATEISSVLRLLLREDLEPLAEDTPTSAPAKKLSNRQKQLLVMSHKGLSHRDIDWSLEINEHGQRAFVAAVQTPERETPVAGQPLGTCKRDAIGPGFNCRSSMNKALSLPEQQDFLTFCRDAGYLSSIEIRQSCSSRHLISMHYSHSIVAGGLLLTS